MQPINSTSAVVGVGAMVGMTNSQEVPLNPGLQIQMSLSSQIPFMQLKLLHFIGTSFYNIKLNLNLTSVYYTLMPLYFMPLY